MSTSINHTTDLTHAETAERAAIDLLTNLNLVDQALNGVDADVSFDAWLAASAARKALSNLVNEIGKVTATAQRADRAARAKAAADEFNSLIFAA